MTPTAQLLIVDDEAPQMKALCDTLEDQGYATTGFTSAKEALTALHQQNFDLLLTDLMMPERDGIALLRSALDIDPHIVGIIMTGHGTINTAVAAMQSGALDYILKPFKLTAILPVLSRALAVRQLRLENAALQQRLRERTAQLEAANKELEAFSFSVSHDLRAPVRHINSFAGLLEKSEPSLSEEGRRYLGHIVGSAKQMDCLIDDLLEFSRTSGVEMRRTRVNLQGLLEEAIERLQPEIKGRNILWKTKQMPEVQGDPALLLQVFSNLLLNAVKYTCRRDPAEIETGCANETPEEVVIFVRDNGVGFDMEYADKLFGVFQRLHRAEEFEGTGIGLATVRRVIGRHGGRTWAEGKVGEGATFYFTLKPAEEGVKSEK